MMNVKLLKEYAYGVLEVAIKSDTLKWYVAGIPLFSIKSLNEFGQEEECIFAKMEAVYQYYKNNPDSKIDIKLEEVLTFFTLNAKADYAVINFLKYVEYQIVAEKENRAPFAMNNEKLLSNLKQNLEQNKKLYQSDEYGKKGFMATIQQHNEMLSRNYGYKIL